MQVFYWALKCVEGKCKNCCNIKPPEIPNLKDKVLHYSEFVVKNVSYVNKKNKIKNQNKLLEELLKRMPKMFMMSF